MNVKILTDTAADLTAEEAEKLQVTEIVLPVIFSGESEEVTDKKIFWEKLLAGGVAKTSQPSREVFEKAFTEAKEGGYELVCILLSPKLSGAFESAVAAKKQVGYDKIYLADTAHCAGSAAEKMLVFEACKLRDAGASAQEIVEKVTALSKRVRLYACLDSLLYLGSGGRIPKSIAAVGTALHIKPMITFTQEGNVAVEAKSIGLRLAMKKMVEVVLKEKIDKNYKAIPIYADRDDNLRKFLELLGGKIHLEMYPQSDIGATIATHIGPNAFGLVYVTEE